MFTGIVEQVGYVSDTHAAGGDLKLTVRPERMWDDLSLGESIAISGVCLTVEGWDTAQFQVTLSQETVAKTADAWRPGALVNLERALRLGDRLGGHLVSGHVDGVGRILKITKAPGAFVVEVRAPEHLSGFLSPKGSVTVDGVSLTVVDVGGPAGTRADFMPNDFSLWLIPHTLQVTSLRHWQVGNQVNVEADQIAKYLGRLLLTVQPEEVKQ
jgi:riboflavin synthase